MIELPDLSQGFEWENRFYLSCEPARIGKLLAHAELFQMVQDVPGAIVECGVFKGASLARFASLRELFGPASAKRIIGFDTFGPFPEAGFVADEAKREEFVASAGDESISSEQLMDVLRHKGCDRFVELIEGDICHTVPQYVREHPELRISLLNLDTDLYEPAVVILEHLFPLLERGGVLLLDDYGTFPGETQAVEEFFRGTPIEIRKFPYCMTPCYLVKP